MGDDSKCVCRVVVNIGVKVLETKYWPAALVTLEFGTNGHILHKGNSINNVHFCTNTFEKFTLWVKNSPNTHWLTSIES